MLSEQEKDKIIEYYLKVKDRLEVCSKFKISSQTFYNILNEREIPKPSEIQDKYDDFDPEHPFVDTNGNKAERLVFKVTGNQRKAESDIDDKLGDNIEKMVKYTRGLVQYAKNIKEFANILQEVNNEQRELQQINKFIESTDILEFLKPKTADLNQSNSEMEKDTEKPLIDSTFLMMVANPNITPELRNALIYSKIFTIISRMKPEDFNLQINPNQVKNFIDKYNEILKVKERMVKTESIEVV